MGDVDTQKADLSGLLQQQAILARFGEFALRSENLDDILTEACRLIGEALGTDLAKVVELQPNGTTLMVRAGVGWKLGVVGVAQIEVEDDTSEGHALKSGRPLISTDIAQETRFRYPPFLVDHGVKAVANVPIIGAAGQPPFGLLQVDSRSPREFTTGDSDFLSMYANLIAAAVDRLRVVAQSHAAEVQLREGMERQQDALATGLIGFFEWNVPAATMTADRRFAGFYGLDPDLVAAGVALGTLLGLVHLEDRAAVDASVAAALASCEGYAMEFRVLRPDGTLRWMHMRGHCTERQGRHPLRYTGTAVDVTAPKVAEAALRRTNEELEASIEERTHELMEANARLQAEAEERERVEEALRQSHKMEAVGQLTGGIAHDFNNLLTGISGSLELIRARTVQGRTTDLERYINAALTSAGRAAALTHRLLAFSRRQTLDPKPTDVNRLVTGMEDLVRRSAGPGIKVEMRLAHGLWPTLCDPNQLESALLNLCLNARDATPANGQLVIETSNAGLPGPRRANDELMQTVPPGDYVTLSVTDSGTGMTPDVLMRAFDPFFTTKPIGQGTGLGLSMIYGFVQQSGGHVRLRSEPGQGTTVMIYLPRYPGTVDDAAPSAATVPSPQADASTVVLVVEDEPAVRMIIQDVLSERGYTVLEAEDARSGLTIIDSDAPIDLLLTDVGLPSGMNGRQLADAARVKRPGLRVLFVTGFAEAAAVGNGLMEPGMEVMIKPFAVDALATRVEGMVSDVVAGKPG